ncbi:MAG: hypothetical protein ABIZ04_21790 [Opitutus sp.]
MTLYRRLLFVLCVALLQFLSSGCASRPEPRAYAVQVTLDGPLAGTSVQVDIVGANEIADLPKWQTYSVTQYWQPENAFRRDARKFTLQFSRDKPTTQSLSQTDPHWAEWLQTGAMQLVVVADLPGPVTDQVGNADPRRLILPLDRAAWGRSAGKVEILVQESGLRLMTPRKL